MPQNTPIKKDWFMSGLLVGMSVSVLKTLISFGLAKVGIPVKPYVSTASAMVFARRRPRFFFSAKQAKWERAVGHVTDIAFGGAIGVAISYLASRTPPGNELTKGAATGLGISAGTMVLAKMLRLEAAEEMTPQELSAAMALAALFGGVAGAYFGRYGSRLIAQSHPMLVKQVTNQQFDQQRMTSR